MIDGGGIIPEFLSDWFNCEATIVVLRAERLGARISGFNGFLIVFCESTCGGDPKMLMIPGLSALMPNVLSISSNVGDYNWNFEKCKINSVIISVTFFNPVIFLWYEGSI